MEEIVNMIRRDLLKEDLDKFLKTVGSPMYQSPELVTTKTDRKEQLLADFRENPFIIFKIDIWAAGIML